MRKTDINIGDLIDDLADYLDVSAYELAQALQNLVKAKEGNKYGKLE